MNTYRRAGAGAGKSGVTARFANHDQANRATRALQKELKMRPEDVSASLAPGIDPAELQGQGGYIGITKAGAVLVHARTRDAALMTRIKELLVRLGGNVPDTDHGSISTGGYGPTTANGTRGVFGGAIGTSSMANHLFTQADEPDKEIEKKS